MDKENNYHVPEGFHPFICMDTIRGLTDAIHLHMHQGPGTQLKPSRADQGALTALIDELQKRVHTLHAWFIEIENIGTVELPVTNSDFESLRE